MGFLVGSRRHIGGAGDLLGIHPDGRTWLVEAKDSPNPYKNFGKAARRDMIETQLPKNSFRFLVHRKDGKARWVGEAQWPK
jgi:hypothetical protein